MLHNETVQSTGLRSRSIVNPTRRCIARAGAGLLAWLLLEPPLLPGNLVGTGQPLAVWKRSGSFPTPQACEQQRANNQAVIIAAAAQDQLSGPGGVAAQLIVGNARCVAEEALRPPARSPAPTRRP